MKTWPKIKSAPLTQHGIDNGPPAAPRRPWYARLWSYLQDNSGPVLTGLVLVAFLVGAWGMWLLWQLKQAGINTAVRG
jgi:hypothetical protein